MRGVFKGSIVAIVTPFFDDGKIDFATLERLVEWQIESGTDGIVPCGTTGESPTLSHEEHEAVVAAVVAAVRKRIPVLAGAGSNNTTESLRLVRFAEKAGADGALVITPYYNKPTPAGLVAHYQTIAAATRLPIVMYNVPGRTGINLLPETVALLAQTPNIIGIKEASGSLDQVSSILQLCKIDVLSGDDGLTLPIMAVGGCGVISVVANVAPKKMVAMTRAMLKGDLANAERLHREVYPLCKALFVETNPIPVKAALAMMGKIRENLRLPLVPLSAAQRVPLAEVVRAIGEGG
ncbi:MAG: 4-hydroxy-tetrahydrodipicolinate synthase [bacterium]|nr:4-hydroxy-tetrahydrodipicolinate synthase [bacterium]